MIKLIKKLLDLIFFKNIQSPCYYINSNNLLPQPLEEEEETRLLLLVKDGDIEARNTLIEHNLRLVIFIAKKFESTKINMEDLISIGSMGLIKGIQTFKMEKNIKLATYASRCIENEILMHIRSNKKRKDTLSLYSPIGEDKEGNEIRLCDIIEDPTPSISDIIIEEERNKRIHKALKILNKREYEIICRRFGLDGYSSETQREIAKSMGISRSYVSRIEKRVLTKLYLHLKEDE